MTTTPAPTDLDRIKQEIEACAPEFENHDRPWNQAGLTLVQVSRSLVAELAKARHEAELDRTYGHEMAGQVVNLCRDMGVVQGERDAARKELAKTRAELATLRMEMAHPAVAAVADLVKDRNHQYRRAEAAHDAKDEANRRWLDAANPATTAEPAAEPKADSVDALIERSSLGTPGAVALREQTDDETARRIVAQSKVFGAWLERANSSAEQEAAANVDVSAQLRALKERAERGEQS